MSRLSRRSFIAAAATAAIASAAGGIYWWRRSPDTHTDHATPQIASAEPDPNFPNPLRLPGSDGWFGMLDVSSQLTIVGKSLMYPVIPGKAVSALGYQVESDGKTFINPILRVRSGAALRVKFWNALDETSIIHWHGLKVDANNDGHPHYAVPGGATYDYQFTVANRAGTYWYHPHPHGLTGKQVYRGMAGLFVVEDDEELVLRRQLDLTLGATDIPLVLQDRRLDADGTPVYAPDEQEWFHGYLGDQVLVNLTPRPYFNAATRIYRLRLLNASNARLYRLAFMHGGQHQLEFSIIGNDGGLLSRPYSAHEVFLAPAERVEVLIDLRSASVGDFVLLKSLAFDAMHAEIGGSTHAGGSHEHHGATDLPDGAEIDILKIHIERKIAYDRQIPQALSRIDPISTVDIKPRPITLDRARMQWRINGLSYDMTKTPIRASRNTVEVWEFRNVAQSMPHPMHIHGFQFQVLQRLGSPTQVGQLAITEQKLVPTDLGWKDTVLVWPGETVRVAVDFSHPFLGDQVYMLHCHNLEHEDRGMMLNFKVVG